MYYELKTSSYRVVLRAMRVSLVNRYALAKGYRWVECDTQIMRGYFVNASGDRLFVVPIGV